MIERPGVILILAALAAPAGADHLIGPDAIRQRLEDSTSQRARDLAAVDAALASPEATRAAGALGADLAPVRAGLSALTDAELRELAARASLLDADPAAGRLSDTHDLLVILLVVLIVLLVLKAV